MVAPTKIRCAVVAITADNNGMTDDASNTNLTPRFRPSDLVPWADPYIAGLVRKLQAEVRSERKPVNRVAELSTLRAELELPWHADSDDEQATPPVDADRRIADPQSIA
ncbi:MAG: hypothetical protein AAGG46_06240 [Planctomycetota bacterium]